MSDPTAVLGPRLVAAVLDSVAAAVVYVLAATGLQTSGSENGLVITVAVLVFGLFNLVLIQGATGSSLGKAVMGLRVVDAGGEVCGFGRALGRWLLYPVDAFPWVLPVVGPLVAWGSRGHQRVGDQLAGTYVIRARDAGRPVALPPPVVAREMAPVREEPAPAVRTRSRSSVGPVSAAGRTHGTQPFYDDVLRTWVRWDGHEWLQQGRRDNEWRPHERNGEVHP